MQNNVKKLRHNNKYKIYKYAYIYIIIVKYEK